MHHYEDGGDIRCTFDAIIRRYHLRDPALLDMAEVVRTADAHPKNRRPEGAGLEALALGFREVAEGDHDNIRIQFPLYDALYAYCKMRVHEGRLLDFN